MRGNMRLAASVLAIAALALIGATAGAAVNPHATFTCTKTKKNGSTDVQVSVPESAVSGLTSAGFTCIADVPTNEGEEDNGGQGEDQDEGQGENQDEGQGEDESQDEGQPQDEGLEEDSEDESETTDDGPGDDSTPEPGPKRDERSAVDVTVTVEAPSESRSLYCATRPVEGVSAEGHGVALDLPETQGAQLVEKGLATPAIFYAGIGVSCDLLPGFVYSGHWADHVGDVIPGVAVYPYYVPSTR